MKWTFEGVRGTFPAAFRSDEKTLRLTVAPATGCIALNKFNANPVEPVDFKAIRLTISSDRCGLGSSLKSQLIGRGLTTL